MTRSCGIGLLVAGAAVVLATGCGEDDFANDPRPASPKELTGVIQEDKVTVSPRREGAGAVLITISNQTDDPHTVILEGEEVREQTDEIAPLDTASIQKTLKKGTYEVRAGSNEAQRREIAPAILEIGDPRKSSSDELLLP